MKKSLILLAFFAANLAQSAEQCSEKELAALQNLQAQLVAVCGAVDFSKLPADLQNQGLKEQCETLGSREITAESCAILKAEIEKNAGNLPQPAPAQPQTPQSPAPAGK